MADQSLRGFIANLRQRGEILHSIDEIDPDNDMSALAWKAYAERGKATLFTNIKGHPGWRVVSQIVADRRKWAIALGVDEQDVVSTVARRISKPLPTVDVPEADAACREIVKVGDEVDLTALPAMWTSEDDPGRYIASGMCIVRNPETGARNVSYHRAQVVGRNRTGFLMLPRQAATIAEMYRKLGRPMEVAMVIGAHPMIGFAGAFVAPFGVDEMTIAGGLLENPIRMTKCATVDLEVPADAEIVLEGVISQDEDLDEGPFGEVTGTYGHGGKTRSFSVKAITHRADPIFYAMSCGLPPSDTHSIVNLTIEMRLWQHLREIDGGQLDLLDLRCLGGVSPLLLILQVRRKLPGQAKAAMLAALSSPYLHPKFAIAIDEDIDPSDLDQVMWAIATRVNASTDITKIDATRVFALDAPSPAEPGVSGGSRIGTKMLIDATKPFDCNVERFDPVRPPGYRALRLDDYLEEAKT